MNKSAAVRFAHVRPKRSVRRAVLPADQRKRRKSEHQTLTKELIDIAATLLTAVFGR
ncbi:hypothetical protein [Ancylobacter sp.]|uniref:hypothetical protein n=1 Tax=Ancylobacter sp. TaxID=1872567 RepID=UPI003D104C9A